jgi:hypothetical protein
LIEAVALDIDGRCIARSDAFLLVQGSRGAYAGAGSEDQSDPWIAKEVPVRGFTFDGETGRIREVEVSQPAVT